MIEKTPTKIKNRFLLDVRCKMSVSVIWASVAQHGIRPGSMHEGSKNDP